MNVSAWTHFIATLLSIAGLSVLVVLAVVHGEAIHVISFSIFGAALILLYVTSTFYHFISHEHFAKKLFQTLDHSMIYVLIAGTYTPLVLVVLPTAWGWSIFGTIWGLALIGVVIKILAVRISPLVMTLFYMLMGWLIMIAFVPLSRALSFEGILWLMLGGLFYTVGAIFFVLDEKFNTDEWYTLHDIFHVLVMLGSFSHFWFMLKYVLPA